jgi:hypothetical protein
MKYYSEKTKQMYDDTAALEVAEEKYDKEHAAEIAKKEARAAAAKKVEDLYKDANAKYKEANDALKAFVKEYGSYHTTITNADVPTRTLIDHLFDSFFF